MRVAMVSPYDWSEPGGVNRHVEGLTRELLARGHDVRVFAPAPEGIDAPDWLTPLGRTMSIPFNGARSNVTLSPVAAAKLRRGLQAGDFEVVHLHEPVGAIGHRRPLGVADAPVVGSFHTFSERWLPHAFAAVVGSRRLLNRLHVRIAVSEPAAWTGRRFYGGEYRIVPNGVDLPAGGPPPARVRRPDEPLHIAFVGQPVERKGLPVLLRAFEALRDHIPARLSIVGAEPADLAHLLEDPRGVTALGRLDDDAKRAVLESAHVLCAPALGGESFGMVLTEAFAAGTPVVASDIAGYRSVVTPEGDGVLVAPGDAAELATVLHDLATDPERLRALAEGARKTAGRYAWPVVADAVLDAYADARAVAAPQTRGERAATRLGLRPADGGPRRPPQRLAPLDGRPSARCRAAAAGRRLGVVGGIGLTGAGAFVVLHRLGWHNVVASVLRSSPAWVLVALVLMCLSMFVRAVSWHAVLRAAPGTGHARLADAMQGTAIGVLMSATLPARLGEVSRAMIVARRLGRPRERLPTVLGTMISQTALNVLALVVLGIVVFSQTGLFAARHQALLIYALTPVLVVGMVLGAPSLLGARERWRATLARVRSGLTVFRRPMLGALATIAQLSGWALQCAACAVLLEALGLDDQGAGFGAAAGVLFAVNITAVLPVTPSNLGVFQAACVAVLSSGYHVHAADAFAYGIILQAVELATAVVVGAPALLREGVTWREVRLRALHSAPVRLRRAEADATSA